MLRPRSVATRTVSPAASPSCCIKLRIELHALAHAGTRRAGKVIDGGVDVRDRRSARASTVSGSPALGAVELRRVLELFETGAAIDARAGEKIRLDGDEFRRRFGIGVEVLHDDAGFAQRQVQRSRPPSTDA